MKNPWMSLWLSAANQMTGAARGQMMAEMSRQQTAMMKAWTEAYFEALMAMWLPATSRVRARK